ncbi:MAG: hypothetical protein GX282_04035 [Campylobacteraceae bacterium]|nr:hypothetical protein [Campylobacteraceae bacterium]
MKKFLVFIAVLSGLFAYPKNENISFEANSLEQNSSNLEANLTLEQKEDSNLTQNQNENLKNSIYIHGGSSFFKEKYIVNNKFVKKDEIINSLNESLMQVFGSLDNNSTNYQSSLSYEIYKFSIEENHSKFWVNFDIECSITDMTSKEVKKQMVSKSLKVDDKFDKNSFQKAINLVADEIYKALNSTILNQDGVKILDNGGVVLPF